MKLATFGLAAAAVLLALDGAAVAQGGRPPAQGAGKPAEPAPPPIFPCRTAEEVCFLGVVSGAQVLVIYTNAPNGRGIETKPQDAIGPDGNKLDLAKDAGRVVMLTGAFDPKTGITKAELVEVASPLASLAVKAQLAGGGEEAKAAPRRR